MDSVRSANGLTGPARVHERGSGNQQKNADAFRRALEQESSGRESGPDGDQKQAAAPPMARRLQLPATPGRRDEGQAMHVDVIA
jgi:hypothetical protein